MKSKVLIFLVFLIPGIVSAQQWKRYRKEVVFGAGATNCLTDLGGANQIGTFFVKDFEVAMTRPALMFGYRYRINKAFSVRGNVHYGRLKGNDQLTLEPARNYRNIIVRTDLIELGGQMEYMFIKEKAGHRYQIKGVKGWKNIHLQTYLFAGIGGIFFNPQGPMNGRWYNLQPLGTEGQGLAAGAKKYSRFSVVIPGGIGFRYGISRKYTIGLEAGIRKTFTDYLDDTHGIYYDNQKIVEAKGTVAGYFADPSSGVLPGNTMTGQVRGLPKNDNYMFMVVTLSQKLMPHRTKAKF